MKKLSSRLLSLMMVGFLAIWFIAQVQASPEITQAVIHPERAKAGDTVYFGAQADDPDNPDARLQVGVFLRVNEQLHLVMTLNYIPQYGVYLNSLTIPDRVPNGKYTFYFIARNSEGEASEPVPVDLTIYSVVSRVICAPRGVLIDGATGAVKNYHRGEKGAEDDSNLQDPSFTVKQGTIIEFKTLYEGIWYDDASGSMGTAIALFLQDENGEWHRIDEDVYRSDTLEGSHIKWGTAKVTFNGIRKGTYTLRLEVGSYVNGTEMSEPLFDRDNIVFTITVE